MVNLSRTNNRVGLGPLGESMKPRESKTLCSHGEKVCLGPSNYVPLRHDGQLQKSLKNTLEWDLLYFDSALGIVDLPPS